MSIILITGARAPVALEFSRSFAKDGYTVILADSVRLPVARWSNKVHRYYQVPSPRYAIQEYITALNQIIKTENVSHLIPTCEEAFYIALHKQDFDCKVWVSEIDLMHSLHNKYMFPEFAGTDLPIPKTILLNDFEDWDASDSYVFKPVYSRFSSATMLQKKVKSASFKKEIMPQWIAQHYIQGKEICVYSIWNAGELKAFVSYHPLYKAGRGSGIFFEPVEHQKTLELVTDFGKKIKYTGQLCFDVIIDQDNNPHFIECNPRGTSGAHLIHDQIADAYLGNKTIRYDQEQDYSIKYAMAILYPHSFFKKKIRISKDVIYHYNDKRPFFLQILCVFEITYLKFKKRTSWLEATTQDIEWNGYEY